MRPNKHQRKRGGRVFFCSWDSKDFKKEVIFEQKAISVTLDLIPCTVNNSSLILVRKLSIKSLEIGYLIKSRSSCLLQFECLVCATVKMSVRTLYFWTVSY